MALITVSGHLLDASGVAQVGAPVTFELVNLNGNLPYVSGTNIIVTTKVSVTATAGGVFTAQIQGNDTITPSGTFYKFTANSNQVSYYQFVGVGPYNLDSTTPLTTFPIPVGPLPTQILTGNNTFTGSNNFTGPFSVNPEALFLAGLEIESGFLLNWNDDTGLSRTGISILALGNGIQGDASGTFNAAVYQVAGTQIAASNLLNGVTGSGSIVLSVSPILTGTISAAALTLSSALSMAAGQALSWNSDTGISRDAAGVIDFGNGTPGDKSGTINAATANITGVSTLGTLAFTTLSSVVPNANYGNGLSTKNSALQSQVVVSGTEYYVTSSGITMPATFKGGIQAGSSFVWRITMTKTAAGTGTFQILFKHGATGSISDTTDATITVGTQTAAADCLTFDLVITFTSATVYYYSFCPVQQAATATGFGLVYPAVASMQTGTVSGLTTTTGGTIWGLSFKATTGTPTITVPMVQGTAYNIT